ncbi:hypothetical protein [Phytohabitans rumicis]|uniref:PRC-barrel domain-containing protein n=1 Tax=Phytohabitans rumicis TaxID=1076125 RepID=A0A6V8LGE9_9ACTN|nr:hypothetical protein [Phytohabitans rumicis]GFJ93186.1 hypothetical protein Prum_068280 [Phytohabitans rumicis]
MTAHVDDLVGRALHASDSRPVGKITAVYHYPTELAAPAGAVAIAVGLLRRTHLVDLENAEVVDGLLTVPHDRNTITSAPSFTPMVGDTLSQGHAMKVREHYWGASQPV